jgi:hypothetical protein
LSVIQKVNSKKSVCHTQFFISLTLIDDIFTHVSVNHQVHVIFCNTSVIVFVLFSVSLFGEYGIFSHLSTINFALFSFAKSHQVQVNSKLGKEYKLFHIFRGYL